MDESLSKLKKKLLEIDTLRRAVNWGPEFQLWLVATSKLVQDLFGEKGLSLFNAQQNRTTSYIDPSFNKKQYLKELNNRKIIIEGLMSELAEQTPSTTPALPKKNILKEIWHKKEALKGNLLTTHEAQELQRFLISHLEELFTPDSIPGLKLRKIRTEKRVETWWSDGSGYPTDNAWEKIQPFLEMLEQHEAEKTIKNRFETQGLFVESRSQGGDLHILVGERNGSSDKAHIIVGDKSGEIRIEHGRQEPTEILKRVEAILTLPNGQKIRTTREAIEEVNEGEPISVSMWTKYSEKGVSIFLKNTSATPLHSIELDIQGLETVSYWGSKHGNRQSILYRDQVIEVLGPIANTDWPSHYKDRFFIDKTEATYELRSEEGTTKGTLAL